MSSETMESTRGIEFLAWLEINKKRLIAAGFLGALLVGGLALYRWRSAQLELEANSALVLMQSGRTEAGQPTAEPKAQELLELATRYGTTQAGRRALLLAAGALFREGKYSESLASFESFRSDNAGSPLMDTALLGRAACLEALGKTDEAMAAYRDVIADFPESASASHARLSLAGLLESRNEFQQALGFYDQLATTAWANEAGTRRRALLASHPELAPTNSPQPELTLPGLAVPPPTEN